MRTDNMTLGEDAIFSTNSDETGLNNNVIVCGSSGCGKTMSISEPCLLDTYNSSLIVTVTKRRIVDKYKSMFRRRGYIVEELNFINPLESSVSFDPLRYICSYQDVTFLAESIVKANPRKDKSTTDPYWDQAATSLIAAEISLPLMTKKDPTFADVLDVNDRLDFSEDGAQITTSLDKEFKALSKKDPSCFAVSCWKSFRLLPIKTASCVFGTLNTTLDTIFSPELRKMIARKKTVDFEQLATRKTVLFISTSAVNPVLHCFINIFYAQAFKTLFEYAENMPNGKLPIPVRFLCDDFATGSQVQNFPEYISVFREKQISVTLLVQSESQLESIYGSSDAITIINNCDTYLYMGGMDLKTGRSISERLNVPLEDVLYMPIGRVLIFRRGQRPIVTTRYNIMSDERYQQITHENKQSIGKQLSEQIPA